MFRVIMRVVRAAALIALVIIACQGQRAAPPTTEAKAPDDAPTGVPTTSDAASSSPGSAASGDAARPFLPPIEDACATDADCTVIAFETSGPHICCPSCKTTPVTKAWAKQAERCHLLLKKVCYPLACPMGPMKPKCDTGRCVALP